jgi:malate synthase
MSDKLEEIVEQCVENLSGWSPRHDDPVVQKWFKHFITKACEEWEDVIEDQFNNARIELFKELQQLRQQLEAKEQSYQRIYAEKIDALADKKRLIEDIKGCVEYPENHLSLEAMK